MCITIPEVRMGEPQVCGGVTVFPLFAEQSSSVDYLLSDEAMAAGTLAVSEVSETGEVPFLLVDNGGDQPALFVEGEEVRGGKQNRILASSVLVAGRNRTRIPVACTEPGRWDYDSRHFTVGSCCPPSLRHVLKDGGEGRQARVWATIRQQHLRLGVRSRTGNMSDASEAHRARVTELRGKLPYAEGDSGIAVALGDRVVAIDVFDKPETCKAFWGRIAESLLLDAAEAPHPQCRANRSELAVKLYNTKVMRWQQVEPVIGLGEQYRARDNDMASTALIVDGNLLHLSVSMRV
jgi:hypothetical protein